MINTGNLNEEILMFRSAVESSAEAIFMTDLTGLITYINPEFTNLYGYSSDEVVGKVTPRILKSGLMERDDYRYFWDTLLSNKVIRGELINKTKDGLLINVEGSANPILNKKKEIVGFIGIQRDISSRKRSEIVVKQSEELFRKAFMTSPDAININRLSDGMYVSINRGFTRILGFTEEEVIGKTALELNIWVDHEDRKNLTKELSDKGSIENFEAIFRKKDGNIVNGLMSASIIELDGIPHILSETKDITELKSSQEQLFLLANALKSINECVSITDMNDNVLFLNQAFLSTYGFTQDDLKEVSISFIRSPDNPPEIVNKIVPATLRGGWQGELLNRRKDGREFQVSLSTAVIKNPKGQPIALIGVANDITSRKRTELENQIIYEITQGITTTSNLDELLKLMHHSLGKAVYAENFFVALYNQKTGFFSFPYFVDKFDTTPVPTAMTKSCTAYVFRTGKPFLFETELFNRLKEQNEVELVGSPSPSWIGIPLQTPSKVIGVLVLQHYEKENVFSESDKKFLISIGNQIALSIERKKAEEEIKVKNEQLQTINAEKDMFFSILAHDLRGPLSTFVAATQIITEEIQTMEPEEIKEITGSMKTSAINIYTLLENLLEWSRLQRGAMDFVPEKFNLKNKIRESTDLLSETARKKAIEIGISISDDLEMLADKHMFDTIIRNLVSNAIKFTMAGGLVTLTADFSEDNTIEVKISDSGIGMSQELKNKLFLINEKSSRPGTDGEPSTGLGLLLCKEFVEKHGGKIWVTSKVARGSVFSFTIRQF